MELNLTNLLGPLLVAIAFLVFGKGMVNKRKGKSFRPLPAFVLMLFALGFRFIFGEGPFFDRFAMMLFDFGIGMTLDAAYLAYHREQTRLFLVPGILALLFSGVLHLFGFVIEKIASQVKETPATVHLLLELGPDDHLSEVKPVLKKYKAVAEKAFPNVDLEEDEDLAQFYVVYVDSAFLEPLSKALSMDRENVDYIDRDYPVNLIAPHPGQQTLRKGTPYLANDPKLGEQWFAASLAYNQVYELLKDKQPAKKTLLAIVDTGVDGNHEDISGVFKRSPGNTDGHGHGTHCAGIAGAATNNGKGVGSLNWEGNFITVTGFHALDQSGRGTDQTVAKAIIDAAESGADVISMSLGGFHPRPPRVQVEAIKYAHSLGAIVVVAAGNSNDDARRYSPANIDGVIVVGAVDEKLNKAVFSNINTKLKMPIAAPGVNIMSSTPGSKYQAYSGTSMATPLVAGLISVMKSFNPELSTKEVYKILKETGQEVKTSNKVGKVVMPLPAIKAAM